MMIKNDNDNDNKKTPSQQRRPNSNIIPAHAAIILTFRRSPPCSIYSVHIYIYIYILVCGKGRHEVFFDEVEDFECPECGAPRSAFYDANDKDDPHNQKVTVMRYDL